MARPAAPVDPAGMWGPKLLLAAALLLVAAGPGCLCTTGLWLQEAGPGPGGGGALGDPETWLLAGDHDTACLASGWLLREVDRFLLGR